MTEDEFDELAKTATMIHGVFEELPDGTKVLHFNGRVYTLMADPLDPMVHMITASREA